MCTKESHHNITQNGNHFLHDNFKLKKSSQLYHYFHYLFLLLFLNIVFNCFIRDTAVLYLLFQASTGNQVDGEGIARLLANKVFRLRL